MNVYDVLQKLAGLRDNGNLSDEEFDFVKEKLLHSQDENAVEMRPCPSCYYQNGQCSTCNGQGDKRYEDQTGAHWFEPCYRCHGSGLCQGCQGRGEIKV